MDGEHYSVSEGLQKEVVFHKFNLMDPFPFICRVYIIFLRNVMIYFDPPTRQRIMQKVYDSLEPGGYLFIGMSETVDISRIPFEMVQPSIFRKPLTNP
jgi:chemotaxis protein methyltransferase CheR